MPSPNRFFTNRAFTLIELLIVVAIIAILAAIAVPNFLEAQTRSKVSRMKADMRTVATALESYAVDYNRHPLDTLQRAIAGFPPARVYEYSTMEIFNPLTTPIAYITSLGATADVFQEQRAFNPNLPGSFGYLLYVNYWPASVQGSANNGLSVSREGVSMNWMLASFGPDGESSALNMGLPINLWPITASYDPTNGTVSFGDIARY
ncbi:MAG: prepilin-type N-terminal cleavage/methylation domain-containing protein [Candidatus Sumerlaeia bacterium]|nr:prepilin-type N-terminal cleavage/methylation domain-containing protein [Candidatus Sumerlaeia bacterium]